MRVTKSSVSVLALSIIMLVANASAYQVGINGGSGSFSANGATAGATSNGYVTYAPGVLSDGTTAFDHVLTEYIDASVSVAQGQKGSAAATYSTNGNKAVTQQIDDIHSINVGMDGNVGVSVDKTSTAGVASASAQMLVRSAFTDNSGRHSEGGEAYQRANIFNSGKGTATAFTSGSQAFNTMCSANGDYAMGGITNGGMQLNGSNSNLDQNVDAPGGEFSADGEISTLTYVLNPIGTVAGQTFGIATATERLNFHARRGISFSGESNVEGQLAGTEMGESSNTQGGLKRDLYLVDNEATTSLFGSAKALIVNDRAESHATVIASTWLKNNGAQFDAYANTYIDTNAKVERHYIEPKVTEKAMATSYIDGATWTKSARTATTVLELEQKQVSITGEIGSLPDGRPVTDPLKGFGAEAWIDNTYVKPVTADVGFNQYARTKLEADSEMTTNFWLNLDGMANRGKIGDSVGAFGSVKNVASVVSTPSKTVLGEFNVVTKKFTDVGAINWIAGTESVIDHQHPDNHPLTSWTANDGHVYSSFPVSYKYSTAIARGIGYENNQWENAF